MKYALTNVLLLFLIITGVFYLLFNDNNHQNKVNSTIDLLDGNTETEVVTKITPIKYTDITDLEGKLYKWIGKGEGELVNSLGEPLRKDLSSYGYTWWVYTNKTDQYIQFGINEGKVTTIYATGERLPIEPITIGQTYKEIDAEFNFKQELTVSKASTFFRFKLTPEDIKMRPLAQINSDSYIQFYFDTFTDRLSAIRILNSDVLLTQRPYEVFYRGDLPDPPLLSEEDWAKVDVGMEQQIFDITNVIRQQFERGLLKWDNPVSEVASNHSKDMEENNYFSHYTQKGRGLKDRLKEQQIYYTVAGENIAAQYIDGPAAVEGWLNSESHREALLKNEYTHLGVGVYKYYYTQNFLQKH